jgi:hypothetical protein
MKRSFFLVLVMTIVLLFTSCDSLKAKYQVRELRSLVEYVSEEGASLSKDEWSEVFDEYELIVNNMELYTYTAEQMDEINKLKGRFYSVAVKNGIKTAGKKIGDMFHNAGNFLEGFVQGVQENSDEIVESVEDKLEEIEEALDDVNLEGFESLFE